MLDVPEMMFGLREHFKYARCVYCSSLWCIDPPEDPSRFYDHRYYSMSVTNEPRRAIVARLRAKAYLALPPTIARRLAGRRGFPDWVGWFAGLNLRPSSRIADVGSGNGNLLRLLSAFSFQELWGFDPFIPGDRDDGGIHLRATSLDHVPDTFDLVMFNHSLEHVADPVEVLAQARERLRPGGSILARVPIAGSWADREYGVHWVGLDAPRHLAIPSVRGIQVAAERSGLSIRRVFYDSWSLQFWGSQQYRRGIRLRDPRSVFEGGNAFSAAELAAFDTRAQELNKRGEGDLAGFVLR